MPLSELKSKYRKVSSLEKAQTGWEEEYEVSSKQVYFFSKVFFLFVILQGNQCCLFLFNLGLSFVRTTQEMILYLLQPIVIWNLKNNIIPLTVKFLFFSSLITSKTQGDLLSKYCSQMHYDSTYLVRFTALSYDQRISYCRFYLLGIPGTIAIYTELTHALICYCPFYSLWILWPLYILNLIMLLVMFTIYCTCPLDEWSISSLIDQPIAMLGCINWCCSSIYKSHYK